MATDPQNIVSDDLLGAAQSELLSTSTLLGKFGLDPSEELKKATEEQIKLQREARKKKPLLKGLTPRQKTKVLGNQFMEQIELGPVPRKMPRRNVVEHPCDKPRQRRKIRRVQ